MAIGPAGLNSGGTGKSKVSITPLNIEDHVSPTVQVEDYAFSHIQCVIVEHASILQRIYDERTAGDSTFSGVLSDLIQKIQKIAEIANMSDMDNLIKINSAELKRIYDERTAGDYTFMGVLGYFMLDVNLDIIAG